MSEKPPAYAPEPQAYPAAPGGYPPAQPQPAPYQQGPYPPVQGQPQPGGYPPAAGQPQTVVVTQPNVIVAAPARLGQDPQRLICPHCQADIVTRISYETGLLTWLIVGALCIFVLWPCCLIPFCVDACKDVTHNCPNCNRLIGTYKRLN